jgi:uncharacterized protein YgiB involved in biofilm formation
MVRMNTIEKERFRHQCDQLWNQQDCRYQTVEVKNVRRASAAFVVITLSCVIIKNVIKNNQAIYEN